MIKNLSKADVEFIKRCLRFTRKNKKLNDKDSNRTDYLLNTLGEDETSKLFTHIYKSIFKSFERN